MLDKGSSNAGSAMVSQKDQPSKENPSQSVIVENTAHIANDQDIPRILATRFLERRNKEEIDRFRAFINSTSKSLGLCGLTMKGKSSFNIFGSYPKKQLIIVANGDHVPIVGSGNELTTGRTIGVAKEQSGLYYLQHKKIDIHRLGYLRQCFHIYLQKSLSSPLSIMFISFQSTIMQHFLLVIIKVLNILTLFILMYEDQLVTLYPGLSALYHLSNICQFFRLVKNQFDKSIKRLQSENGTKFVNLEFSKFLKDNGMVHELMCVNTPQQNEVVKRKNRHLFEVARALLFQIFVPNCYHPMSRRVFVSMDDTFHETRSFFVSPPLQGKSYLEVEPVIESLPFPTQDVIESLPFPTQDVQVQEVTKPTLVPKQVQLSKLKVSILKNPIEDVTNDMPIALRKGK
ncbi:hypothetical protein CR513_08150, partial [Mucuna pruriens]